MRAAALLLFTLTLRSVESDRGKKLFRENLI